MPDMDNESSALDISKLRWPEPAEGEEDTDVDETMGWINRDYADLRGYTWQDARTMLNDERELLSEVINNGTEDDLNDLVDYETWIEICEGLDLGVASAVVALSAAGCIPLASCNGSAGHAELCPVIVFRCPQHFIPTLLRIASDAGCRLQNAEEGAIALFSNDIKHFLGFAERMIDSQTAFEYGQK